MREFKINKNDAGQRLDKFILKAVKGMPMSLMYKAIRTKKIKVNRKRAEQKQMLIEGDIVQMFLSEDLFSDKITDNELLTIKPQLDIVYEDENILIVNKEAGVVVHADEKGTKRTLIAMIQSYLFENNEYNPETENTFRPALCNRLDRNTGGLIIAAKNIKALRCMNEGLKNSRVNKYYKAVTEGYPPQSGRLEGFTVRNDKKTTIVKQEEKDSKNAVLDYNVISHKDGYSLLSVKLYTGRTHQIRSQFSAEGFPLAGDIKYGGHSGKFKNSLWSVKLEFCFEKGSILEYLNEKTIEITAPFENEF